MSAGHEIGGGDGHAASPDAPGGPSAAARQAHLPAGLAGRRRPRAQAKTRAKARASAVEAHRETAARILVVDDEEVVRMLVVDLLRERGHMVREAEDGVSAMAQLRSTDMLDLMITDIGLPNDFDGSTLARRARALRPGLPILFITGYAFGARGIVLEPGIPVLTKPFTLNALSERIAALLQPGAG